MRTRLPLVLMVLVFAALALPNSAHARRRGIPFIINTGSKLAYVAELPEGLAGNSELQGWAIGYKYEHFGILWADVWTWEHELVAFKDDTYSDLPADLRAELESQYSFSDADRNIWNRFGAFIMLAVFGGYTFLGRRSS